MEPLEARLQMLRITAQPGVWGEATPNDVVKVCVSAAVHLLLHCSRAFSDEIEVRHGPDAPTLVRATIAGTAVIQVNAHGLRWSQYAYQFAREFSRLLAGPPQSDWFRDAVSELAGVFVVERMAATWSASPDPHWKSYAPTLRQFADGLESRREWQWPDGGAWLRDNEPALRANSYDRNLIGQAAMKLLPLFRDEPKQGWTAIQKLPEMDEAFAEFVSHWHDNCAGDYRQIVRRIATAFGV
jgi:hypothetical protein